MSRLGDALAELRKARIALEKQLAETQSLPEAFALAGEIDAAKIRERNATDPKAEKRASERENARKFGAALGVPGHHVGCRRLVGGLPPSALWRRTVL